MCVTTYVELVARVRVFALVLCSEPRRVPSAKLDRLLVNEQYLTRVEHDFVCAVEQEVTLFCQLYPQRLFLVFPPLPPRFRFLIHQTVSQLFGDSISTKSVGKEGQRRLVLCLKSSCMDSTMSDAYLECENADSKSESFGECTSEAKSKMNAKKQKRPDKQLYIPPRNKNVKSSELDDQNQSKSDKSESPSKEKQEPSWDSLYDDNGDVIDSDFVSDLNCELGINALCNQLAVSKLDYTKFTDVTNVGDYQEESGTILEIYDFSSDLKTRDLITSLSATNSKNFDIDWVDDTHALIIFVTPLQAAEALNKVYPNLKLRPLSQGIRESQLKAKKKIESKIPRKPRPETTTLLARRLVAGALGIKADMNPEQRKAEREKLRLAKEKKQQVRKQVKNIWEGNVS